MSLYLKSFQNDQKQKIILYKTIRHPADKKAIKAGIMLSYTMALRSWWEIQTEKDKEDFKKDKKNLIEYESVLDLLKEIEKKCEAAFRLWPSLSFLTNNQMKAISESIESLKLKGWAAGGESFLVYILFCLDLFEMFLHIPKRANGSPKKNGWVKDKTIRLELGDVRELLISCLWLLDPDLENNESIQRARKGMNTWLSVKKI